jgi:hypothetical protein
VEFDPPDWHLSEACPCCGQGRLKFSTCPACGSVVLICSELNTVFGILDRQSGSAVGPIRTEPACAACGAATYSTFRPSTSEEVRALGFRPGDYH